MLRTWIPLLVLGLAFPAFGQPQGPTPLVDYSFDNEDLATGPDTLFVVQSTKGSVRVSGQYKYSGYRSLEIRSVAGDSDFPELQGYFPLQEHGTVYFQFALLVTNPQEPINIALAGHAHFTETKNGLGFWLKVEKGVLQQVSGQKTLDLLPLDPFVWYLVRCTYYVDRGTYDLEIRSEFQQKPAVRLAGQANVMNAPGSSIYKYSFVSSPFGNNSNAVFYVDDIWIAADSAAAPGPFVAPGRRKLFVDLYDDQRKRLAADTVCLPAIDLADLGLGVADIRRMEAEGALNWLQAALRGGAGRAVPDGLPADTGRRLRALETWRRGCTTWAEGEHKAAVRLFEEAASQAPEARVYAVSGVLAAAALGRWSDADQGWIRTQSQWRDDVRFGLIAALLGMARKDLDDAEIWLRPSAEGFLASPGDTAGILAEQYYYVLLWRGRYTEAQLYAARAAEVVKSHGGDPALWLERRGDAYFFAGDYVLAGQSYEQAVKGSPANGRVYLKLSDVWFKLGDKDKECYYREMIYGALK